jgi:hypothetical protein
MKKRPFSWHPGSHRHFSSITSLYFFPLFASLPRPVSSLISNGTGSLINTVTVIDLFDLPLHLGIWMHERFLDAGASVLLADLDSHLYMWRTLVNYFAANGNLQRMTWQTTSGSESPSHHASLICTHPATVSQMRNSLKRLLLQSRWY